MFEVSSITYLYFFSTSAQVFGALLGLIGLAYVRTSEIMDKNLYSMLRSVSDEFGATIKNLSKEDEPDLELEAGDLGGLQKIFDEVRELIGEQKYAKFSRALQEIENQVKSTRTNRDRFIETSVMLIVVTLLSIFGVATADMVSGPTALFMIGLGLITSMAAILLSGRLFLQSAQVPRVFIFNDSSK